MTGFLQACGGALIAVILYLTLGKQGKDMGIILTVAVCCMILLLGLQYLQPVMELLAQLESIGGLDGELMKILLKAAGIGFLSEIACLVCADAGNSALGKALQIAGSCTVLWLSVPLFRGLLELLQQILGGA